MTKDGYFNILKKIMATRINFVDLYSFHNELDSFVIEAMMVDLNISCSVRSLASRFSSDPSAQDSELRMSVEEGSIESARRVIDEALKNGVISRDGEFMY
ncbi:MAG: hypothetical protein A2W38_00405 [Deltaproteobacteria bacterium RBG_19FT_COMBO_58_16]|nr:MAG: hypothetical protein A2W38_00405 [Deltaproteobacteria bacterium RBG_19FT_COMBO_58_16]